MDKALLQQIAGVFGYTALFAVLLFVPAGRIDWWQAWVLLGVLLVVRLIGTLDVWRVNRELLIERSGLPVRQDQPLADKVLLLACMASYAALVAFCAWDVHHLPLLAPPVPIVSGLGLLLFAAGWLMIARVLKTNAFAATVIRHQQDRGHTVVDTGVYSVVRHPMYASLFPVMAGLSLWLGSSAGALLSLVPMAILAARIVLEERFLKQKLAGYAEYTQKVRWRLIPGIW
ncbi:MAG: isoprenylcysteine carboxylmethyltransferase family protein [Candidatus Sericytochromatia bacterium]